MESTVPLLNVNATDNVDGDNNANARKREEGSNYKNSARSLITNESSRGHI